MKTYFVFDAESMGLGGEIFAIGGGFFTTDGRCLGGEFLFACSRDNLPGHELDKKWIEANVPQFSITHPTTRALRDEFWKLIQYAKSTCNGIMTECCWPVESKLLLDCLVDDPSRRFDGPYPLLDIATLLLAIGEDPVCSRERLPNELPAHNPLQDARQSARLMAECFAKLSK